MATAKPTNKYFRQIIKSGKTPNIIVKPNTSVPDWRKLQARLGSWKSLCRKNPAAISATLPVEKQFDEAELRKIHMAIHYTNKLNIDMNDKPDEAIN